VSARAEFPAVMDLVDVTTVEPGEGMPPWRVPGWLDEVSDWIDEQLAPAGMVRIGTPALRGRMWSVVVRVPVEESWAGAGSRRRAGKHSAADRSGGTVWFKANPAGSAFEPALLAALARWAPDMLPSPLAVDTARAWTLSEDAGTHLRELLLRDPDPDHLRPLLQRYARMQRALVTRTQDLLALGMPDLRPQVLPGRFEALLARPALRSTIDEAQYEALAAFAPVLREHCRELDGLGIPASLDHGDLHPNNVFGQGERALASDWGDGAVAHPFSTLLVLLRSAAEFFDADGLAAVRAAYLEPWMEDGYRSADVERAAYLAMRVAPVLRAVAWVRVFPCFAQVAEPNANAARWLGRLLDDDPLTVGVVEG
jgi:hypothetical protein